MLLSLISGVVVLLGFMLVPVFPLGTAILWVIAGAIFHHADEDVIEKWLSLTFLVGIAGVGWVYLRELSMWF